VRSDSISTLRARNEALQAERDRVATERDRLATERDRLATERDRLATERDRLATERDRLATEREQYRELYLRTLEQCRKLELGLLGQKAERVPPNDAQLTMALLATLLGGKPPVAEDSPAPEGASTDEGKTQHVREHERKKPTGRRPLPENLPRVDVQVLPPEVEREGTDAFERIGAEVCETLEHRRASLVVVRVTRPKFVRKARARNAETEILVGATPELPIERGLAGPGLLADTLVRRWQDHLPLARLESIYAREGIDLDRSTICTWHSVLGTLVAPLLLAMWKDAMTSTYLCTDATGVLVQAKERCRRAHFFVVVAPERHVLYAFTPKHDAKAVDRILKNYKGYLVADAHAVYEHLYATGAVVEVACWSHLRRYFFKSLDSEPERARQALAMIAALFALERRLATGPPGKRRSVRQRESKPIVERFFAWCDEEAGRVLDDTPLQRALTYARNQRTALQRFLDDERLPLDNNISERSLRRLAVGRKNWLFLGSDDAGSVNASFTSLLASCQLHGIEPWSYLRDLLCLLPSWPQHRVLELAPAEWNKTLQQQEAQQRLAANVFRRVTL
jgi:transposase